LKITEGLAQISNSYIDLLVMETKAAKVQVGQSANVPSIFFGGGTPSLMQPDDIGRVISTIKSEFTLLPNAEITMECNPDTVTKESLAAFRAIGVNRVSFGMQSAVKHVLATLDRTHNPENLLQVTTWAQEVGFSEISVDLIYGTPGESLADWQTSIDAALALPITHISAYALIVEEGTKLAAQIKRGEVAQVDDDLTAEKYLVADKAFTAAGFEWYELSNWAKSGSLSKHNLAYWLGDNWWGAGPGAHSHLNGKRFWNVKHPNLYKERVLANQSPVADSEVLEELQIESERLMLSLRLPSGVDKQSLNEQQLAELSSYVESGHLDQANWNQGRATLTLDGRLIADRILRQILL
jgi:oxygen-independent coproporphyrinogen-3 oxidase